MADSTVEQLVNNQEYSLSKTAMLHFWHHRELVSCSNSVLQQTKGLGNCFQVVIYGTSMRALG
jgi:hypothetical protein